MSSFGFVLTNKNTVLTLKIILTHASFCFLLKWDLFNTKSVGPHNSLYYRGCFLLTGTLNIQNQCSGYEYAFVTLMSGQSIFFLRSKYFKYFSLYPIYTNVSTSSIFLSFPISALCPHLYCVIRVFVLSELVLKGFHCVFFT